MTMLLLVPEPHWYINVCLCNFFHNQREIDAGINSECTIINGIVLETKLTLTYLLLLERDKDRENESECEMFSSFVWFYVRKDDKIICLI